MLKSLYLCPEMGDAGMFHLLLFGVSILMLIMFNQAYPIVVMVMGNHRHYIDQQTGYQKEAGYPGYESVTMQCY